MAWEPGFHLPGISRECHPAVRSRPGKILDFAGEKSFSHSLRDPPGKEALLDLLVVNGGGLLGEGMVLAAVMVKRLS